MHILRETATEGSKIVITSNQVIQSAVPNEVLRIVMTSSEEVQPPFEDTIDYENVIDKAYNYA